MHRLKNAAPFVPLPPFGAWRLLGAHDGFEITRFAAAKNGVVFTGTSLGIEADTPWNFDYIIEVDNSWHTRSAVINNQAGGRIEVQTDGAGHWTVNGERRPDLDGCLDLDLEGSAVTNAIPIRRLALVAGEQASAPAAYVRTDKLQVERLDQTYRRIADQNGMLVFDYRSPRFAYHECLRFAPDGLVAEYPGIAARVMRRS